jgi:hypothetical protein
MIYIAKSIAALFALTLFGFAALQFNDPDPVIWVSFYCLCATVPLLLLANKFIRPLFWLTLAICVIELLLSASGTYNYYLHMDQEPLMQSMNPEKPYIEEAREFLGALIALVLVCLSALLARYTVNNNK